MKSKSILVTGGAGFIGSHVVVELQASGYRPVIIDNFSNSAEIIIKGIEHITGQKTIFYKGDFQDSALLAKVIKNEEISGVIHFAALKAVNESIHKPLRYYSNNVGGFITILCELEKFGVKNVVFSSSCTVYGEPDTVPISESSPTKPATSPYGASKQMDEVILRDATKASKILRSVALRYFNPIGAHKSGLIGELPHGIPANLVPFVTQTAAGIRDNLVIYGNDYDTPDGTCIRDYIHVVDLAKAHIAALEYTASKQPGFYDVVNVGTGRGHSVLEIVHAFQRVTGQTVPYTIGTRRAGDIVSIYASVDKSAKTLNWEAKKTLEQSLADAWRWQQKLTTLE